MKLFSKKTSEQEVDYQYSELRRRLLAVEASLEEMQTKFLASLKRYNQRLAALNNIEKKKAEQSDDPYKQNFNNYPVYSNDPWAAQQLK